MKIKTLLMSVAGLLAILPIALVDLDESNPQPPTQEKLTPQPSQPFSFFSFQQQIGILDELPQEAILDDRFSLSKSLEQMQQLETALDGLLPLAEAQQSKHRQTTATEPDAANYGSNREEAQDVDVQNWLYAVEGTLRRQDLEIKQLELQLAQKQFEDGEINEAELEKRQSIYQAAYTEFLNFQNNQ